MKTFLKPYKYIDDVRFVWLDEFLNYFKMSKDSIEERNDAVIMTMQSQKCLFHGKVVKDCKSVFFLSKKYASFCYNNVFHIFCLKNFDLEYYFWKQRAIGRR